MRKITIIIAVFSILLLLSCDQKTTKQPRNIILMIGDGMGVSQITAAMTISDGPLAMEQFKIFGFTKTHSGSDYITDSGASGTAMATGKKTYNGAIGVDMDSLPTNNLTEIAEEHGKSTGIISTSAITHATPASFLAHEKSRHDYENIAGDYIDIDVEVLIGGGYDHFNKRKDNVNLLNNFKDKGYTIDSSMSDISIEGIQKLILLTAAKHNPSIINGRDENYESNAVNLSLEILSRNQKGFFLMIEGSQIDWGGHANDEEFVLSELLSFDRAVKQALEFARKNPETLVIVTSDHETGGFGLTDGDRKQKKIKSEFLTDKHTGSMVPVMAFGPGAEEFGGIYENTAIFDKLKAMIVGGSE